MNREYLNRYRYEVAEKEFNHERVDFWHSVVSAKLSGTFDQSFFDARASDMFDRHHKKVEQIYEQGIRELEEEAKKLENKLIKYGVLDRTA